MSEIINVKGKKFKISDSLEYITLADSFVKNKIGTGHGEGKLYVGNESQRLTSFFEDYTGEAFFVKDDFLRFLQDAEQEFLHPQQEYVNKDDMPQKYSELILRAKELNNEILTFKFYRVNVNPPRVYINSKSDIYTLMRVFGLPNISYVSVLKLIDEKEKLFFYFKMFVDYKSDIIGYIMLEEQEQELYIKENELISAKQKIRLIQSRIGQGEYRERLLAECSSCPFTGVNDERLLIASHIKPWAKSNDREKIDAKNGFVLTPTFDKLFDKGFISFSDDKELIVSPWLSPMNQKRLGIYNGKMISNLPLEENRKNYLEYHREFIFKK